jgi:hypothetical protein
LIVVFFFPQPPPPLPSFPLSSLLLILEESIRVAFVYTGILSPPRRPESLQHVTSCGRADSAYEGSSTASLAGRLVSGVISSQVCCCSRLRIVQHSGAFRCTNDSVAGIHFRICALNFGREEEEFWGWLDR